jgi:hypothetical protein
MAQTGYTPILVYASGTATNVPLAINLTSSALGAELALNYADGKLYYKNSSGTVTLLASAAGSLGDVVGPASATDNALARFDLTTGKLIQNSVGILSDTGALSGITDIAASGSITLSGGTANGVAYLNGSKVLTTGSALTFSGSALAVTGSISSTGGFTSNTTITAQLDGSDSAGAGPGFNLFNTAFSRGWRTQLSASNNKVDYYFNGSAYVAATTIDTAGNFGLGVTPPTSTSGSYIWNRGGCSLSDGLGQAYYVGLQNTVFNSGFKYVSNGFAGYYVQGSGGHFWYSAPTGTAGNAITFTQVLAVQQGNTFALQGATPNGGTGITFPATQSASTNANTLDDYEEGTWTPVLTDGVNNVSAYYYQYGSYIKVGRMVTMWHHQACQGD